MYSQLRYRRSEDVSKLANYLVCTQFWQANIARRGKKYLGLEYLRIHCNPHRWHSSGRQCWGNVLCYSTTIITTWPTSNKRRLFDVVTGKKICVWGLLLRNWRKTCDFPNELWMDKKACSLPLTKLPQEPRKETVLLGDSGRSITDSNKSGHDSGN